MIKEVKIEDIYCLGAVKNNNPFVHYLGAVKNNKVIGYIEYNDLYDSIDIVNVFVEEKSRRNGIASLLMENLIKIAKENNKKNITLEVNMLNESAIFLYTKYGFKKVAVRKGYYKGIDGYLMELVL